MELLTKLNKINQKSIENKNKLNEIVDWSQSVDQNKIWFPESLTHLYHCPVYKQMDRKDQIIYNQSFASLTIEQTLFLEVQFLSRVFEKIKHITEGNSEFLQVLNDFVSQEQEHTLAFRKLLIKSNPRYQQTDLFYFKNTATNKFFVELACSLPEKFFVWAWLALYAEEKFVLMYREANKQNNEMDALHLSVHKYHMYDELNHTQVDDIIIDHLWEKSGRILKKINAKILTNFLQKTVLHSCHSSYAWNQLVSIHPHLSKYSDSVLNQLSQLGKYTSYKEMILSKKSFPIFFRKLNTKDEFKAIKNFL